MIKVNAAQRLNAMLVRQGDNFKTGSMLANKWITNKPVREFKVLQQHKNQLLLRLPDYGITYMLVSCVDDTQATELAKAIQKKISGGLGHHGAKSIDAFIEDEGDGTIVTVWVDKKLRGRGYGKALYQVAHHYSKKGIRSSDALSTMSLSVWLSMFKSNPRLELWVDKKPIPRKDVKLSGFDIYVPSYKTSITKPQTPRFEFRWPK